MNKLRSVPIAVYAVLIFLAGGITGTLVAPVIGRTFMRPPAPHEMSHHMLTWLESGLDLNEEQKAKIRPIVEKTGADMDAIRRATTARVRERIAQTNAQITQILTPEQREKFVKMEAEHRKRMGARHSLGERPPPPP